MCYNKLYRLLIKRGSIAGQVPERLTIFNLASKHSVGDKFEIGDLTVLEEDYTSFYEDKERKMLFLDNNNLLFSMMGINMNQIYLYIENKNA